MDLTVSIDQLPRLRQTKVAPSASHPRHGDDAMAE